MVEKSEAETKKSETYSEDDINVFARLLNEKTRVHKTPLRVWIDDGTKEFDVYWMFVDYSERPQDLLKEMNPKLPVTTQSDILRQYLKELAWRMIEKARKTGAVPETNVIDSSKWAALWNSYKEEMDELVTKLCGLVSRTANLGF